MTETLTSIDAIEAEKDAAYAAFKDYVDTFGKEKPEDSPQLEAVKDWVYLLIAESNRDMAKAAVDALESASPDRAKAESLLERQEEHLQSMINLSTRQSASFAQQSAEGESSQKPNPYQETLTHLQTVWYPRLSKAQGAFDARSPEKRGKTPLETSALVMNHVSIEVGKRIPHYQGKPT